jgi:chloramphenicol 3-O phosphotransferase
MEYGNIVLLNGVTSAGKSTLAKKLQAVFDEPYYYVALDTFNEVICPFSAGKGKFQDPEIMNRAVSVMHLLIRDFSQKGLNVIVDHILCDYGNWFIDCIDILHEYPVMFVRVDCERDELFRRAQNRGYTTPERLNQIDQQLAKIHKHGIYDLMISTSAYTTEENATIIKQELSKHNRWTAFKQLKQIIDEKRS